MEDNENTLKNDPETESSWPACTFEHKLTMSATPYATVVWLKTPSIATIVVFCCFLLSFPHCKFILQNVIFILSAKSRFEVIAAQFRRQIHVCPFDASILPLEFDELFCDSFKTRGTLQNTSWNVSRILDEINTVPSRPQGSVRPQLRKPFPCTTLLVQSDSLFLIGSLRYTVTAFDRSIDWLGGVIFYNVFLKYLYAKQNWPNVIRSDQKWPKVTKSGQKWPKVTKSGQKWPKVARSGQKWSKSDQKWPKVARILRKFKKSKLSIGKNHRGMH